MSWPTKSESCSNMEARDAPQMTEATMQRALE